MSRQNRNVDKKLDIPSKRVYNIRKDGKDLTALSKALNPGGWNPKSVETKLKLLISRVSLVKESLHGLNLPTPVIAGGAIRDLIIGRSPKDYDVFISFATEDECYEALDEISHRLHEIGLLKGEGGPDVENDYKNTSGENAFKGVYSVFNTYGDIQYIIGVWEPSEDPTERFDLSSTRCWFDFATDEIHIGEEFINTVVNRQIVAYNDSNYTINRKNNQTRLLFPEKYLRLQHRTLSYPDFVMEQTMNQRYLRRGINRA